MEIGNLIWIWVDLKVDFNRIKYLGQGNIKNVMEMKLRGFGDKIYLYDTLVSCIK